MPLLGRAAASDPKRTRRSASARKRRQKWPPYIFLLVDCPGAVERKLWSTRHCFPAASFFSRVLSRKRRYVADITGESDACIQSEDLRQSRGAVALGVAVPSGTQAAEVGNIEVCYNCTNNFNSLGVLDGPTFEVNNLTSTPLTNVMFMRTVIPTILAPLQD